MTRRIPTAVVLLATCLLASACGGPGCDVLESFTSDPVANVNEEVFESHADADWLSSMTKVGDGSSDGIDIETDLKVSKETQYLAVEICEAYTEGMSTRGELSASTDWCPTTDRRVYRMG